MNLDKMHYFWDFEDDFYGDAWNSDGLEFVSGSRDYVEGYRFWGWVDDGAPIFGYAKSNGGDEKIFGGFNAQGIDGFITFESLADDGLTTFNGRAQNGNLHGVIRMIEDKVPDEDETNYYIAECSDGDVVEGSIQPQDPVPFLPMDDGAMMDCLYGVFDEPDQAFVAFEREDGYKEIASGFGIFFGDDHDAIGNFDEGYLDGKGVLCYHDCFRGVAISTKFNIDEMDGPGVLIMTYQGDDYDRVMFGNFTDEDGSGSYGNYPHGVMLVYRPKQGFSVEIYDTGTLLDTFYEANSYDARDCNIEAYAGPALFLRILAHLNETENPWDVPEWLFVLEDDVREALEEAIDEYQSQFWDGDKAIDYEGGSISHGSSSYSSPASSSSGSNIYSGGSSSGSNISNDYGSGGGSNISNDYGGGHRGGGGSNIY